MEKVGYSAHSWLIPSQWTHRKQTLVALPDFSASTQLVYHLNRKSLASPSFPQACYKDRGSLLHRLPGLSVKALVNRLSDGSLHQIHISNHQRSIQILKVFVELSIAQMICGYKERVEMSIFSLRSIYHKYQDGTTGSKCMSSQSVRRKSLSSWKRGKLSQLSGDWISRAASMSMA